MLWCFLPKRTTTIKEIFRDSNNLLIDSIFEGKKNGRLFIDPGCIESTKERRSSRLSIYRPDAEHTHKRENRKKKRAPTPSKRSVTAGVNKPPCAETGSTQPGAANRFKNFFFPRLAKNELCFHNKREEAFFFFPRLKNPTDVCQQFQDKHE